MAQKYIEHWDDERNLDHGIIVTLRHGWSFYEHGHQGVMGFETVSEAREATKRKNIYPCKCNRCRKDKPNAA